MTAFRNRRPGQRPPACALALSPSTVLEDDSRFVIPGTPQMAPDLGTTAELLFRIRKGDLAAREALTARYLPILKRWARGRLPAYARDLAQTDDLVQDTLVAALAHLNEFEIRREGAFLAYLRSAFLNRMRDEIRRVQRRPVREALGSEIADHRRSVVEEAVGRETLEHYEAALAELSEEQREAVMLRLEFGYTYPDIANAMGKPTANAARMVVARALVRIVEAMNEFRA
jgi:RNA polymerase sigma-70 factor (ECF subfamily)